MSAPDQEPSNESQASPTGEGQDSVAAAATAASAVGPGMPFYLLLEPLLAGRSVVDVLPAETTEPGHDLLRRAGVREIVTCSMVDRRLEFPSGAADAVLCQLPEEVVCSDEERRAWLSEIQRILGPSGICALRLSASTVQSLGAGGSLHTALVDMLLEHFATVDVIEETPFSGVSFYVPGTEDLAVNEALVRLVGVPEHLVALCGCGERTWSMRESLLVPVRVIHGGSTQVAAAEAECCALRAELVRLEELYTAVSRERDSMREAGMTQQDRADRLERMVAALRRDVARHLRQISDDAAARELLSLERDGLKRSLDAAERQAQEMEQGKEKQESTLRALEKEVARLRAARGIAPRAG